MRIVGVLAARVVSVMRAVRVLPRGTGTIPSAHQAFAVGAADGFALGEAGEAEGGKVGVAGRAVGDQGGHHVADGGGELEAVAGEADGDVAALGPDAVED